MWSNMSVAILMVGLHVIMLAYHVKHIAIHACSPILSMKTVLRN